jgi:hypothetical protein
VSLVDKLLRYGTLQSWQENLEFNFNPKSARDRPILGNRIMLAMPEAEHPLLG